MRLRVLAFARVADVLGWTRRDIDVPDASSARDVWGILAAAAPDLAALADSTRIARNGRVVTQAEQFAPDDEIALLPPAGGG
jgi:molybdopterin synthase catalytic subunit